MNEQNEQIKVAAKDIPEVAKSIKTGFLDDGWIDAGVYPIKGGKVMGFLDDEKKFLAIVSLTAKGKSVSCSYKVDKFNPEMVESEEEGDDGNPMLVIGGITALAASAIAFPLATLGAAIVGLGAALLSSSTEDEVTARAIRIIREQLTDIEAAIIAKRKVSRSKKYDIFISYRHDNGRDYGRLLYEYYKNKGKSVFFYPVAKRGIHAEINRATCEAVRNSQHVLVVLSKGFFDKCINRADGCRVEIETALDANKSIIPIRLPGYRGEDVPKRLPQRLIDFAQWQGIDIPSLGPAESAVRIISQRMQFNLRRLSK